MLMFYLLTLVYQVVLPMLGLKTIYSTFLSYKMCCDVTNYCKMPINLIKLVTLTGAVAVLVLERR